MVRICSHNRHDINQPMPVSVAVEGFKLYISRWIGPGVVFRVVSIAFYSALATTFYVTGPIMVPSSLGLLFSMLMHSQCDIEALLQTPLFLGRLAGILRSFEVLLVKGLDLHDSGLVW